MYTIKKIGLGIKIEVASGSGKNNFGSTILTASKRAQFLCIAACI
jgi:hypothetical protein